MNIGFFPLPEPLPSKVVERGKIIKRTLCVNPGAKGITEISILDLSPGAIIGLHTHDFDYEIYYLLDDNLAVVCEIHNAHSFENDTKNVVRILSVKSTIPFDELH